jgi:hypothetical protein
MKMTSFIHTLIKTLSLALFMSLGIVPGALADGNKLLPFWAQPYPSGYAGGRQPPDADCYVWKNVDTFLGTRRERVWVCDSAVTERY